MISEWDLVEIDTTIWMEAEYAEHVASAETAAWRKVVKATGPRKAMKAIETNYDGYRFRSRLEARWAVFFNALGIKYLYETEGFVTSAGPYLPDFFLPGIHGYRYQPGGIFVEVKGGDPSEYDYERMHAFGRDVVLLRDLLNPRDLEEACPDSSVPQSGPWYEHFFAGGGSDAPYHFCECRTCGAVGLEFDGRSARITCACGPGGDGKQYNAITPRIIEAFRAARSARFEHGEHPSSPSKAGASNGGRNPLSGRRETDAEMFERINREQDAEIARSLGIDPWKIR